MKVTAILKGMIDSNGHQPIQIRIYHNNKSSYKPTGIKVPPDQFKDGKVTGKHPKAREYNQTIQTFIIQYQAQALDGFKKKIPKTDFYKFVDQTLSNLKRRPGSVRQYRSQINKLNGFAPVLYISDINKDFLNNFRSYLEKKGNNQNTVWTSFKVLKTFVRLAKAERLLSENPFEHYEMPRYEAPDINYLTAPEVALIDRFAQRKDISPQIKEAANWFLLGCYTGLRISDIKVFNKSKHIVGGRLVMTTQKTREIIGLPVLPRTKKLFERVNYKALSMHENTYNGLLKVIAGAVGINKNLHAHLSRHTCAMLLTDAGVSQEVIAKILGHKSLSQTRQYSKVSNKRIDMEMKKVR